MYDPDPTPTPTNHYITPLIPSPNPHLPLVENTCWNWIWCFWVSFNDVSFIRNLELKCQCYCSCKILAKSLQPPLNLCRPLKIFACVYLRYRKWHGRVGVGITDIPDSRTRGHQGLGVGRKTRWHTQPRSYAPPWRFLYQQKVGGVEKKKKKKEKKEKKSVWRPMLPQGAWVKYWATWF